MEIVCKFNEVGNLEPAILPGPDDKKKLGRYVGGAFNTPGFGTKKWAIAAYITPEKPLQDYLKEGLAAKEIVDGCLTHLNKPPTKRSRKPKYGNLEVRYFIVMENKISVSLFIDEKNSKYFWGRGSNKHSLNKSYSKRGRPRGRSKK